MSRVYIEILGDSVELPDGETVIGRDVGCTLRFNDPSVSRRHLRLIRRHDELFVEDLGSANGTLLNGRRVTVPIRVLHGDQLTVGTREITIRIPAAEDSEPVTLLLKDLSSVEIQSSRATTRLPVTVPPPMHANQRCPQCGAAVSADDDECASCHYAWGHFRMGTPTALKHSPLDRRRHERYNVELHLVYVSSELEIEATTRDLSASGVFVCTQVLDPLETRCELTILVDGGPPLHIHGIVRRVVESEHAGADPVGLGIEFVDVGDAEQMWLEAVLARPVS